MNRPSVSVTLLSAFVTVASLLSCQGNGPGDVGQASMATAPLRAGYGRLSVSLIDAPNPEVKEINVTIGKVTAHSTSAGWVQIFQGSLNVDLLKLKDYAIQLGFADLPAGKVTQIRLYTAEGGVQNVLLASGASVPLKVPSGVQSGIKIKGPFTIDACNTTAVTLDFDGKKSIWVHPNGQGTEWILRPVIHTRKSSASVTACTEPGTPGTGVDGPGDGKQGGGAGGPGNGHHGGGDTLDSGMPVDTDGGVFVEQPGGTGGGTGTVLGGGTAVPGGSTITPALVPTGGTCTSSVACLSNVCGNGVCLSGGPGAPCTVNADCSSASCGGEGICGSGSAGGAGAACSANAGCLSNQCVNNLCESGNQGAPCLSVADCTTGFSCEAGACTPVIN